MNVFSPTRARLYPKEKEILLIEKKTNPLIRQRPLISIAVAFLIHKLIQEGEMKKNEHSEKSTQACKQ